jgi:hypothetical protein
MRHILNFRVHLRIVHKLEKPIPVQTKLFIHSAQTNSQIQQYTLSLFSNTPTPCSLQNLALICIYPAPAIAS